MAKRLKIMLLFASAIVFAAAGLFAACSQDEKPITYTVSVTCADASAEELADISVQLFGGSTAATEPAALTDGKAVFSLAPATYTVKLTGTLLSTHTYPETTLTAEQPSATVALTPSVPAAKIDYSVTVTCAQDPSAAAGVTVQLLQGETLMGEKVPENGVAKFSLAADTYHVKLTGVPAAYTYEETDVTAQSPDVTIALTPKPDGLIVYSVTVTCDESSVFGDLKAEFIDAEGLVAAGPLAFIGGSAVCRLAPAAYTVTLSGSALSDYTYPQTTLTAEQPSATIILTARPATGDGSEESPYILSELADEYEVMPQKVTGGMWDTPAAYLPVYYTYTESADTEYTLSTGIDYLTFYLEDEGGEALVEWYGSHPGQSASFSLQAGKTYLMIVSVDDTNENSFEDGDALTWTIRKGAAKWDGAGTADDPYRIENFEDSYEVTVPAAYDPDSPFPKCVYFTYTAAEDKDWVLTAGVDGMILAIMDEEEESVAMIMSSVAGETYPFALEGGKTYLIQVGESSGEGAAVVFVIREDTDVSKGSGTQSDPYILNEFCGTHTLSVPVNSHFGIADDVYYLYTAVKTADYLVSTSDAHILLTITEQGSGDSVLDWGSSGHATHADISLTAGRKYLIYVTSDESGLTEAAVDVTFTVTEGNGSEESPYLLNALEGNYEAHPSAYSPVYYRFTAAETENYTVTTDIDYLSFSVYGVFELTSSEQKTKVFRLIEGETYDIMADDADGNGRAVTFSIAKGGDLTELKYTLTFTGVESSRLSGLKVALVAEGGTKSEARSVFGGSVSFIVAPGTYTVEITGDLMNDYTFDPVTLTADTPNAVIALTPKQSGGTHDDRWAGGGTSGDPYILTSLECDITLQTVGNTSYYFRFTASEDGTYILTGNTDNLYLYLAHRTDVDPYIQGSNVPLAMYGKQVKEFKVFANYVYTFEIKDSEKAGGNVGFKIEKKDLSQKVLSVKLANSVPAFMGKVTVPTELFAQGDEATVTITAKTGYKVAAVKVNGQTVDFSGPQLKIDVQDNTTVQVYYTAEARTVSGKDYYPALVGTWHNGSLGDLVVKADGTVTLGGNAATLTAGEGSETPNRHEFFFDVTVGAQTHHFVYNLELDMAVIGTGAEINFTKKIDFTDTDAFDWDGNSFLGTWTGDAGTVTITDGKISWTDAAGKAHEVEVLPVYSPSDEIYIVYLYDYGTDGGNTRTVFALSLSTDGNTLTLKSDTAAYTFSKAEA